MVSITALGDVRWYDPKDEFAEVHRVRADMTPRNETSMLFIYELLTHNIDVDPKTGKITLSQAPIRPEMISTTPLEVVTPDGRYVVSVKYRECRFDGLRLVEVDRPTEVVDLDLSKIDWLKYGDGYTGQSPFNVHDMRFSPNGYWCVLSTSRGIRLINLYEELFMKTVFNI